MIQIRLNYIDYIKTIGIYLIVLGHMFPEPGTIFIYAFNVPLFFFISGFLFSKSNLTARVFIIKNIRTLLIPYFSINLICLFCIIAFTSDFSFLQSVCKPITGILIGANQGKMSVCAVARPTWFIYTLFLLRIGFYFIPFQKIPLIIITLGSIFITLGLSYIHLPNLAALNCFGAAPIFLLGIIVKQNIDKIEKTTQKITNKISSPLCILIIFIALSYLSNQNGYVMCYAHGYGNNIFLFYLNSILGIYMIYIIARCLNNFFFGWNKIISEGTILILGFHFLFIILLNNLYRTNNILITTLYALFIVIVSIPIIRIIKKYIPWIIGKSL